MGHLKGACNSLRLKGNQNPSLGFKGSRPFHKYIDVSDEALHIAGSTKMMQLGTEWTPSGKEYKAPRIQRTGETCQGPHPTMGLRRSNSYVEGV